MVGLEGNSQARRLELKVLLALYFVPMTASRTLALGQDAVREPGRRGILSTDRIARRRLVPALAGSQVARVPELSNAAV